MRKALLLFAVSFLFSACNNQTTEPKPDAVRVIKDTFAQTIMAPFNEAPKAEKIYARVNSSEDHFLRKQDAALGHMLADMKNKPQHFVINAAQPSEIEGEQGTKLAFDPNSFIDKDGKEISAPVDIELKECYSLEQMLMENIAGNSDGKVMDNRGMIYVNAWANGQQLLLKEGEKINVRFPFALHQKEGYRFFYGDELANGAMNWLPVQRITGQKYFEPKEFTRPAFSYNGLEFENYLHETLTYPEDAKRNELSARVEVSFLVNESGRVTDVTTRESYKIFRNEIARVLTNMPGWTAASYNGKNIPSMVHVDIDFNIRRLDQVKVEFSKTEASLVNSAGNSYVEYGTDAKSSKKASAMQPMEKLGWLNCGRTIDTKGTLADVIVRADSKSDIKLVLKNRSSVSAGENCIGYSRFRNLPVNSEVYIMAVRYDEGKIEYALQPLKLQKQNVVSLAWKKGDEAAVQKAYKRLNAKS
ncbi:MAG: energy transducer TonB [Bacteroidota bacterium]|nr:energy transducer TonB [Bacteroidota bacterium]